MNKHAIAPHALEHWQSAFLLKPPATAPAVGKVNAAVLLPLFWQHQQWQLLMTQRALHLKHHPGQISFPGGKLEVGESPAAAALRELEEEVGIAAKQVRLLGSLPAINTSTGFIVQPLLGILTKPPQPTIDPGEVASVLYVPLAHAISAEHRHSEYWQLRGRRQQLHFIPFGERLIWGASAQILYQLAQQLDLAGSRKTVSSTDQ